MIKGRQYFLFIGLIFLFFTLPIAVEAESKQRIFDHADLLTDAEVKDLENYAKKQSEKRQTDFIIITVPEEMTPDIEQFMMDFYDTEKLGFDKPKGNTAILGIDIDRRDIALHGYGLAKHRLDADRLDTIRMKITNDLSAGNFYDAFERYIALSSDYIRYKEGVNPNNIFYRTLGQLIIAIAISGVIIGLMVYRVNPKVTTTPSTYRDDSRSRVIRKHDRYIRKTVTRKKVQTKPPSGGGTSGPSIGRTMGGSSFSRSRGKF